MGDGVSCTEINACLDADRGGCHDEARCDKIGPGLVNCTCNEGWEGDGTTCTPISLCATATCGINAVCVDTAPGQMKCICSYGYNETDYGCELIDLCPYSNGECHERAYCETVTPEEINCTCPVNTVGDGVESCFGDIAYEIMQHPKLTSFTEWLKNISNAEHILNMENITVFAPSNKAFEGFYNTSVDKWPERKLPVLLGYHILPYQISLDELDKMNGKTLIPLYGEFSINISASTLSDEVYLNYATIVQADITTINGIIHIIDKVIEPWPFPIFYPTLEMALDAEHDFYIFYLYLRRLSQVREKLEEVENFTVLAPINTAWDFEDHKPKNARYFSYFIIPQALDASTLENMEDANLPTLLGSQSTQHFLHIINANKSLFINGERVKIFPRDVKIEGGFIQGINTTLKPVLNICDKSYGNGTVENQCCGGYFGPKCKACPGDGGVPCSKNGKCHDGLHGDGTCTCERWFRGHACELCKEDSVKCAIDPCSVNNGGCHPFSTCTFDYGWKRCSKCMHGFVGDGHECQTPCQAKTVGCHANASCAFNFTTNSGTCTCNDDYIGDGKMCFHQLGRCLKNNGDCDQNALCSPVDVTVSDAVNCKCIDGFIGNGHICTGNTWHTLQHRNDTFEYLQYLNETLSVEEFEEMIQLLSNMSASLVMVLPTTLSSSKKGGEEILSLQSYLSMEQFSRSQNFTVSVGRDVFVLPPKCFEGNVSMNATEECSIVGDNIKDAVITSNGILILLKEPFVKLQLATKANSSPPISQWWYIGVGCGLALLIVAVVLALFWKKCSSAGNQFSFAQFTNDDNHSAATMVFHNAALDDDPEVSLEPFETEIQKTNLCQIPSYLQKDIGVLKTSEAAKSQRV